jgi:hypothetical protein
MGVNPGLKAVENRVLRRIVRTERGKKKHSKVWRK